eukprot:1346808-Ditylum_brightwellii.AAC.1
MQLKESLNLMGLVPTVDAMMLATYKLLVEEDTLKEGVNFHIPSQKWLMLQLSPTDETHKTAEFYTSHLPIKRQLKSCNTRSYHHQAHWCTQMKKIWQHWVYRVVQLLDAAESDPLFIQSHATCLTWRQAVFVGGQDDKTGIPVGWKVPLAAAKYNATKSIVYERIANVSAGDHDWGCFKITTSATS